MFRFIQMKDLPKEVGLSRAQIYKLISTGDFPPLVKLTESRRAARSDLVDLWKENRPFVTSKKGVSVQNRNEIFQLFIAENRSFANPEGHHRKLADWYWDTKILEKGDFGEKNFEEALKECANYALELLPIQQKSPETLSAHDRDIRNMEIARNQEPPTPSGRKDDEPLSEIARICAQRAGLAVNND